MLSLHMNYLTIPATDQSLAEDYLKAPARDQSMIQKLPKTLQEIIRSPNNYLTSPARYQPLT